MRSGSKPAACTFIFIAGTGTPKRNILKNGSSLGSSLHNRPPPAAGGGGGPPLPGGGGGGGACPPVPGRGGGPAPPGGGGGGGGAPPLAPAVHVGYVMCVVGPKPQAKQELPPAVYARLCYSSTLLHKQRY